MSTKSKVEIIGAEYLSYEGVNAHLSDISLSLSPADRSDISCQAKAEIIFYCFNRNFLIMAAKGSKKSNLKFYFEGDFLGELNQYWGYLRAAEGSYTRPIQSLQIEVSISREQFYFCIKGKAGDLIAFTYPANQAHETNYDFAIEFSIAGIDLRKIIETSNLSTLLP